MQAVDNRHTKRDGFTLVELVVVVLILGIIAAIAGPKMFDTANDARSNGTRQSLIVLRDAIELHRAQNGAYPGGVTLATDLGPFLNGPFPTAQVGNVNANVFVSAADPIVIGGVGEAWAYNQTTGELIVNHAAGAGW